MKRIKNALISVYHKDNLEKIIKQLNDLQINIYSTGGTYKFIEELGVKAISVESLTSYPSILGGRVKTLHPKVFGGILSRRDNKTDIQQINKYDIPEIDLVIVDLYPFEDTVASGADDEDIIEKIDIGGISLIRAAAKNFNDVIIVPSADTYSDLSNLLEEKKGFSDLNERKKFALEAFNISSHYDTTIFNYFNDNNDKQVFKRSIQESKQLRYGENPHQKGVFYGDLNEMFNQLHGKEISYNNLLDIDAAFKLIDEFQDTTFAVLKHNNPCGLASRERLVDAWKDALAADPLSAFGGVLVTNRTIDNETAEEINKLFFEVIIAPDYENNALEVLKLKKNRIILQSNKFKIADKQFKSLLNGVLEQSVDMKTENASDMKTVTKLVPTTKQLEDLAFANILVKHTKSNAIVLVKDKQLLGNGGGQTSRVDALKHAITKAKEFEKDLKGAVLASDAFFPFADSVEIAKKEGITAVIQPGGSVRDEDSVKFCDENEMTMVFTGTRHFRH